MGRIGDTWNEVKEYKDDLIVLFVIGEVVREIVVPVLQNVLS